jgi:hypothetical protein
VEALILFATCKFLQREDPDADAWMVIGVATRLALRMGYHRDPRQFPHLSPFECEMRRRTYFIVEAFDLLLSFQAGIPPIINEDECDAGAPSNLLDTDFDEDCKELPPSRPTTDATSMLYFCYKSRFARIFRRVIRHALSLKNPKYEETMKLDNELRETHDDIPLSLQMKPLRLSLADQPSMILDRLNIDLTYLKCVCVLHRKYISHARSNPKYEYSRTVCVDAALQILAYQAELYAACEPGGQFYKDKWMVSSLILYDFLLAAMITCLDLHESHNTSSTPSSADLKIQADKYDILAHTRSIWMARKESSRDARRAANVLGVMLSKIPRPAVPSAAIIPQETEHQPLSDRSDPTDVQMSLPGTSGWQNNSFQYPGEGFGIGNDTALDFSSALFTESDQIDWVSCSVGYVLPSLQLISF